MGNNHKECSVDAFLKDEFFVRWVLNPDDDSNYYWTRIINTTPELRENIGKAREIITLMHYKETHQLPEGEYSDMLDVLIRENRLNKYRKSGVGKYSWLGIAASFILAAAIGLASYFASPYGEPERLSAIEHKQTKKGEKLTVKLPDGTTVKLNANSSLSYKNDFANEKREVFLEGEAYFEVKEDKKHPFVIHTGEIHTTVLGTEFNVRSYGDEKKIAVAVVEGHVKVGRDADYLVLAPNEVSTYHKTNGQLDKRKVDVSKLVAWNRNILYFENATADEVWRKLENWYGVNIIIKNKKNIEGRYSGEYANEPLETVLRGISFASGFQFEIDKHKNVIIK